MFRKRDNDPMESETKSSAEVDDGELPELKLEPVPEPLSVPEPSKPTKVRKPAPLPDSDAELTTKASDLIRSDHDLPESKPLSAAPKSAAANVSPAASSDPHANKRLIVGQGIRLSGEINSCDRLVVEGEVEVTLNDTLALEITDSGRFTGGCEVEEADISGIYEGDLTVRNTLFVRGNGRITGTIRYGQLELERGGQIAGNISVLGSEGATAVGDGAKVRSAKAPLFGGSNG